MRRSTLIPFILLLAPFTAVAGEFRTVCAQTVSEWIRSRHPVAVVDLQSPAEFKEHHFEGAISAGGKPRALERTARRLSAAKGDVVVVTDKGGEEAVLAAGRLVSDGVSRKRIAILEDGMEGAAQGAGCDCCKVQGEGGK